MAELSLVQDTAIGALFQALKARLVNFSPLWADRVFMDKASLGTAYPYVIYQFQAGGALNQSIQKDAELVIVVKAVSNAFGSATACAHQIARALDDAGHQDRNGTFGIIAGWRIVTITQEQSFTLAETLPDGKEAYQVGAFYRVRMGE